MELFFALALVANLVTLGVEGGSADVVQISEEQDERHLSTICRSCVRVVTPAVMTKMTRCPAKCHKKQDAEQRVQLLSGTAPDMNCAALCAEASRAMVGSAVFDPSIIAKQACAQQQYCPKKFVLPSSAPLEEYDSISGKIRIQSWHEGADVSAQKIVQGELPAHSTPTRTADNTRVQLDNDNLSAVTSITVTGLEGEKQLVYQKSVAESSSPSSSWGAAGAEWILWRGAPSNDELGSATFLQGSDGTLTGSWSTATASLSLDTMPNGSVRITATRWNDFPLTHSFELPAMQGGIDWSAKNSKVNLEVAGAYTIKPTKSSTRLLQSAIPDFEIEGPVIDVLILVTNRAMCEYAGLSFGCDFTEDNFNPILNKILILMDQTNQSMELVGVPARVQIATNTVLFLTPSFDGGPDQTTLDIITTHPVIQQWREERNADLVNMITGPGESCGSGYLNSFASVASYTCFGDYILTRVLGFNFGAQPEREQAETQHPYGHAYYEKEFRTVMAGDCLGASARVPVFSANGFFVRIGDTVFPVGDETHDNARLIRETAPIVATWSDGDPPVDDDFPLDDDPVDDDPVDDDPVDDVYDDDYPGDDEFVDDVPVDDAIDDDYQDDDYYPDDDDLIDDDEYDDDVTPDSDPWDTDVDVNQVLSDYRYAFADAKARWDAIIRTGVPSADLSPEEIQETLEFTGFCEPPGEIDDLHICSRTTYIDGSRRILGYARPLWARESWIPFVGEMTFDEDDMDFLEDLGIYQGVILHEMAHILGIGGLWVIRQPPLATSRTPPCEYLGVRATEEYQSLSSCTTSIPLENEHGPGTQCGHWDDVCFENEIMTGFVNEGTNPLSRITVAGLEDAGYPDVRYELADPYPASSLDPSCDCNRRRELRSEKQKKRDKDANTHDHHHPSEEGLQEMIQFGKSLLQASSETLGGTPGFVGDKMVNIFYAENGKVYHRLVWSDQVEI